MIIICHIHVHTIVVILVTRMVALLGIILTFNTTLDLFHDWLIIFIG